MNVTLLANAARAAKAVLPHIPRTSNLRVLHNARLRVEGGVATLVGSDKYTVGSFTLDADGEDGEVLIPRSGVVWLSKRSLKACVDVTVENDTLTLTADNSTASFPCGTGNFPPVEKLLPTPGEVLQPAPEGVEFNPEYLKRVPDGAEHALTALGINVFTHGELTCLVYARA